MFLISFVQTLTDLNDFITPGLACIKPVEGNHAPSSVPPGAASVRDNSPLVLNKPVTDRVTDGDPDRLKWRILRSLHLKTSHLS